MIQKSKAVKVEKRTTTKFIFSGDDIKNALMKSELIPRANLCGNRISREITIKGDDNTGGYDSDYDNLIVVVTDTEITEEVDTSN